MVGNDDLKLVIGRFAFSSDYASGGETPTAADFGLNEVVAMTLSDAPSGGVAIKGAFLKATFNPVTGKVMAVGASAVGSTNMTEEITAHTNLSGYTFQVIVIGR
jgi:hypothetical protein